MVLKKLKYITVFKLNYIRNVKFSQPPPLTKLHNCYIILLVKQCITLSEGVVVLQEADIL